MSERGDIWVSRGFSVTCILGAFIGAVGGAMVGAVFFFVIAGVIRLLFDREKP
jgi:uncharacterized membrane protein